MCAEPRLREQDFGNFQDAEQMAKVYEDRAGQGSGPGNIEPSRYGAWKESSEFRQLSQIGKIPTE